MNKIWLVYALLGIMLVTVSCSKDSNNEEDNDETGSGFLIIQNLSDNYNIVQFKLYDEKGNFLDSDSDVLEPDYQITYEVEIGRYSVEITNDKGKSFKSKLFKVVEDKSTVLAYSGSAIEILATGIDNSELSKSAINNNIERINTNDTRISKREKNKI